MGDSVDRLSADLAEASFATPGHSPKDWLRIFGRAVSRFLALVSNRFPFKTLRISPPLFP
jgi:hypothetical protein